MIKIVAILDRSGSMQGNTKDVIGGYNTFIEQQAIEGTDKEVTLVLFDNVVDVIYENVPLLDVPQLDDEVYYARGSTALHDAMGISINNLKNQEEKAPSDGVVVLVYTDGYENASKEYSSKSVGVLVDAMKERNWEFTFFGADMDAITVAGAYNIGAGDVLNISKNSSEYNASFNSINAKVSRYASTNRK